MKLIFYILECYILICVTAESKNYIPKKYEIGGANELEKQLKILQLFEDINQPFKTEEEDLQSQDNLPLDAAWKYYIPNKNLVKGHLFSIYQQDHLDSAISLFKVFYYSKDFNAFIYNALFARSAVNEGMFLYAVSVAIAHREDTAGLILPPIYEINPYYFFNAGIIHRAQLFRQLKSNFNIILDDDPLNRYTDFSSEKLLTYFTEDIGLNAFYYYYHIFYPWWMDGKEFGLEKDHRGELFYYVMAQLVARYDLERLSNGLEEVTAIDFDLPLNVGFYPSLTYPNGVAFPNRPDGIRFERSGSDNFTNAHTRLRDFALRIQNVVDLGRAYSAIEIYKEGNDGLEILSNLLEGNPNSPDLPYYGNLQIYARYLLGYSPDPLNKHKVTPAATQHYESTLRDPASWKLFKWFLQFYDDFFKHGRSYTPDELSYDGVRITNCEVNKIVTFFDTFYANLNQAVYHNQDVHENYFNVAVQQKRLNHLPLLYNITVTSQNEGNGLIKVFLGPKFDRYGQVIDINENREKFYVLDHFVYKFKSGVNVIERKVQTGLMSSGRTPYRDLVRHVNGSLHNGTKFVIEGDDAYWTFPYRLSIPKGTVGGMVSQLYIIMVPQNEQEDDDSLGKTYMGLGTGRRTGNHTLRFPLDRKVGIPLDQLPNSIIKDILIQHDNHIKP